MGDTSYGLNFDIGKKNEIQHYSQKERFRMQIYTKFANFAGLYFPHFTTFRNQTLQFYSFEDALSSYGNSFVLLV
jgi:hypothetical protein